MNWIKYDKDIDGETPEPECLCPDWFNPVGRYTHHNECPQHIPLGEQIENINLRRYVDQLEETNKSLALMVRNLNDILADRDTKKQEEERTVEIIYTDSYPSSIALTVGCPVCFCSKNESCTRQHPETNEDFKSKNPHAERIKYAEDSCLHCRNGEPLGAFIHWRSHIQKGWQPKKAQVKNG